MRRGGPTANRSSAPTPTSGHTVRAAQALKRKKGNNLATVELSEVLSREQLRGIMMVDTENLLTLAVAMAKAQEKDWLDGYESIGSVSLHSAYCDRTENTRRYTHSFRQSANRQQAGVCSTKE